MRKNEKKIDIKKKAPDTTVKQAVSKKDVVDGMIGQMLPIILGKQKGRLNFSHHMLLLENYLRQTKADFNEKMVLDELWMKRSKRKPTVEDARDMRFLQCKLLRSAISSEYQSFRLLLFNEPPGPAKLYKFLEVIDLLTKARENPFRYSDEAPPAHKLLKKNKQKYMDLLGLTEGDIKYLLETRVDLAGHFP
ncbi:hypothetical protein KKH30_04590 [Candidatus Micrarchaeota archaeon]|nr:hypothetical protein [Candidatus Micrarchaeota archaeon]MBU1940017.1 hypothetical protein [Candidatus Micrarchaeota archaeon]